MTETKGDDVEGYHQADPRQAPRACEFSNGLCLDPGFQGRIPGRLGEDRRAHGRGAGRGTEAGRSSRPATRVNVLPGCHLTPADLDELRDHYGRFRAEPSFLPDIAGSLDGHIPDEFVPTTIGGIGVDEIAAMGQAGWTIAIGAQMRAPREAMEKKTGTPFALFERLCGLAPTTT